MEELRATRVDETPEQASAPTRTVIKKKVRGVVRIDDVMISLFCCCYGRELDVINAFNTPAEEGTPPGTFL